MRCRRCVTVEGAVSRRHRSAAEAGALCGSASELLGAAHAGAIHRAGEGQQPATLSAAGEPFLDAHVRRNREKLNYVLGRKRGICETDDASAREWRHFIVFVDQHAGIEAYISSLIGWLRRLRCPR